MKPTTTIYSPGSGLFSTSYTFSAKERDSETGLSYFGSRYYSSDLSIWLSVDPMSDKYPSLSPYAYCANNPIKLVDPNGETIGEVDEESQKKIDALTNKKSTDYSRAFTKKFNQLAKSKTIYNFREAPQEDIETERIGAILSNDDGSIDIIHSEGGVRTTKEGGFSNEFATLFEETFHASEFDKGKLDLKEYTCRDEAKAWKFATKAPGTALRFSLKDESGQYRNYTFAYAIKHSSLKTIAKGFKEGFKGYLDANNNEHFFMNGKDGKTGLYNRLKLK